jgi:hypothetical protein
MNFKDAALLAAASPANDDHHRQPTTITIASGLYRHTVLAPYWQPDSY